MAPVKRLLIVDDEETLTFSLYQTFIRAPIDCEVLTASSGEEAITRIEEKPFDLVITDLSMPGLSGIELLQYVKRVSPNTKVVIITAYGTELLKEEARQYGASGYLEKPFDIHEMRNTVVNMIS